MAMKLNASEKKADSIIRQYNAQIEKAYKTLGYGHTVTQNLINKARSIFGADNLKDMSLKSVSSMQIDKTTGEVFTIPQIKRNRKTLANLNNAMALKNATQYTKGAYKGNYKSMFDVSKAHQRAIDRLEKNLRVKNADRLSSMPQKESIKEWDKIKKTQLNRENLERQIMLDDLASEIFESYNSMDEGDDTELFEMYQDFASGYHNGDSYTTAQLQKLLDERQRFLLEQQAYNPELNYNPVNDLENFIDILGGDTVF